MQFYNLLESTDTKVTGTVPQIIKMSPDYNEYSHDSIYQLDYDEDIVPPKPNCNGFVLNKRAKPTSLVSCATISQGFICSSQAKTILEKHNLPSKHAFWDIIMYWKGKKDTSYYWFFIKPIPIDDIDFLNSTFHLTSLSNPTAKREIFINSYTDYLIQKQEIRDRNPSPLYPLRDMKILSIEKLAINREYLFQDILSIRLGSLQYFISEKLRRSIIDNNLSGAEIRETDFLEFN